MIFTGNITMNVGFDIKVHNEHYNEKIIRDKIDSVMDDAMGAYIDDYDIKLLVEVLYQLMLNYK